MVRQCTTCGLQFAPSGRERRCIMCRFPASRSWKLDAQGKLLERCIQYRTVACSLCGADIEAGDPHWFRRVLSAAQWDRWGGPWTDHVRHICTGCEKI